MDKEKLMGEAPIGVLVKHLCIPTITITLIMAIYNMTNIFFVGQTGNDNMVSALAVCVPVFMVIQAFGTLIGGGGAVAISIALGRKDTSKIRNYASFCCYVSIVIGIIIALAGNLFTDQVIGMLGTDESYADYAEQYLRIICMGAPIMVFTYAYVNIMRADGSAKESMLVNLAGVFTNMILDPIFILLLHFGTAGAAMATVLGNTLTCVLVLRHFKVNTTVMSMHIHDFTLAPDISLKVLQLGLPTAAGTLLVGVAYAVMNNLLVDVYPNATGAFGVCRTIMLMSTMIQMGLCLGIQPAISYCYGRKEMSRVKEIATRTGLLAMGFGVVVSIACIVGKNIILGAFLTDAVVLSFARKLIVGCMCTAAVYGLYEMCYAYLQAIDRAGWATVITLLRQGIVLIPVMLCLNEIGGFDALVFSFAVTDIIAAAIGVVLVLYCNQKIMNESHDV